MQEFIDRLPRSSKYCSDALAVYQELVWPPASEHVVSKGKEETYTIESAPPASTTHELKLVSLSLSYVEVQSQRRHSVLGYANPDTFVQKYFESNTVY